MQSGAAGGWLVVIAHVVDLVCTPEKPGPVAVSDTYMPLKCSQAGRQTDRQTANRTNRAHVPFQIIACASGNTSLADIAYKNRK